VPGRYPLLLLAKVLAILALVLAPKPAGASSQVEYRAPRGCASAEEFRKAVEARGATFDDGKSADMSIEVRIERRADAFAGVLRVRGPGGASNPREVTGSTCTEVVDAFAVVVALALRQDADESRTHDEGTPSVPTTQVVGAPEAAPEGPKSRPSQKTVGMRQWWLDFEDSSVSVPAGKLTFGSVTSISAHGGFVAGLVPGEIFSLVEFELFRASLVTTPADLSYLVGTIFRVRGGLLGTVEHHSGSTTTRVTGHSGALGLCYSPVFDPGGFAFLACLDLVVTEADLTTTDASNTQVQSKTQFLAASGLGVEALYSLGRHFHLAAKLAGDFTANPLSAENADGSLIWEGSYFTGSGMLGLGGHW